MISSMVWLAVAANDINIIIQSNIECQKTASYTESEAIQIVLLYMSCKENKSARMNPQLNSEAFWALLSV